MTTVSRAADQGRCDASPKGDPAGSLVHVIDERTIALAERPGTRRADGYKRAITACLAGRGYTVR